MWDEHDGGKAAHLMTPSKEGKKRRMGGSRQELRGKRRRKCEFYLGHGQGESFPLQNFIFFPKLNIDQTHPGAVYCT